MVVAGLTNGAYNPATSTWRPIPREPGPNHGAVVGWTGSQMIIWGGICCDASSHDGVAYSPASNTWTRLPTAPLDRRKDVMGAWTGRELIVAGGWARTGPGDSGHRTYRDGAAYNPVTRTWRKLPPMPVARSGGTALWDGTEVLFLGGGAALARTPAARGLAYNPVTNRWRLLPAMRYPRTGFAAVWTGHQVLVWGGMTGSVLTQVAPPHGEAYDPAANRWTALPQSPLRGRSQPVAAWTGTEMIVSGGMISGPREPALFTDGAAFTPAG